MTTESHNQVNKSIVDSSDNYEAFAQRFVEILNAYMESKNHSAKSLAQVLGVDYRTIEAHRNGKSFPEGAHFHKYLRHIGTPMFITLFEPMGLIKDANPMLVTMLRELADNIEQGDM